MKTIVISLLLALSFSVSAKNPHHEHNDQPIINKYITEQTVVNKYYDNSSEGVASAIAQAACQFDRSTYNLQGCVSAGRFKSNTGYNIGLGKRLNADGDLLTFLISRENDIAVSAAYNFKF